ncbi:hypothetical protein AB1Y20_009197 [Prymnesium parvum]|uniref:Protein phosphatase n=1 Tax=Prymnesium parvum TaxID=97485 RepID=A0AB34K5Y2_PRYPA
MPLGLLTLAAALPAPHAAPGPTLRLELGHSSLPKLWHAPWRNEDAFFAAPPFAAVFDGVSAKPLSRLYATRLALRARRALADGGAEGEWASQAQRALRVAASSVEATDGACTACVVRFDLPRRCVACYNLGDSGFLLLEPAAPPRRGVAVVCRSSTRVHADGSPFQLAGAAGISDSVASGAVASHRLSAGQVALCFTDGLLQNLTTEDVARIVSSGPTLSASRLAALLARAAMKHGGVRDDVTVVVGRLHGGKR